MPHEHGQISIHAQNLFPIIKKWLYSEKDIFLRELVSNACDAITKHQKLVSLGEAAESTEPYAVWVRLNPRENSVTISDNGIGMTADEVRRYINQVAFSGAQEFLERYEKAGQEGIIGHFGLGFYSAFMVSKQVAIETKSWQDEEAVHWESDGSETYEMDASERSTRGTDITLYLSDDEKEFAESARMREVLEKYCAFMAVPVYFDDGVPKEAPKDKEDKEDTADADGEIIEAADTPINDTNPLWLRAPQDCTEEDYLAFYRRVFHDYRDPLFWIHLNVDYPFNLKGILYFPPIGQQTDMMEGQVKLYANQVFVADNIKEVIPEYLLVLRGVVDCPDLPLNVSRSFLQNDGSVQRISGHITKKVADKLQSLYKTERDKYNQYWEDIHPFIKYGCLKDEKFYDQVKDVLIFKIIGGDYVTLPEYRARSEQQKDKVYYASDANQQAQYVRLLQDQGMDAVLMPSPLDPPFASFLEMKNPGLSFQRVDAELSDGLKGEEQFTQEQRDTLIAMFTAVQPGLTIRADALKAEDIPAVVLLSENTRRMQDMMRMYRMDTGNDMPKDNVLVLNERNPLIQHLLQELEGERRDMLCRQVYDLAWMSHEPFSPEEMTAFITRSHTLLNQMMHQGQK